MPMRCSQQRAALGTHTHPNENNLHDAKSQKEPRESAETRAAGCGKKVEALKSEKQAARQEVQRPRGHLGALKCAEKRGQCRMVILKARPDRCEEIETARLKLQIVGDELAQVQACLKATLRHRDYLKTGVVEHDSE